MSRPIIDTDEYQQIQGHWLEHNGAPAAHNLYLKIALLFAFTIIGYVVYLNHKLNEKALTLAQNPVAFRINEIGKAEPIHYSAFRYTPQSDEIRYYLSRFFVQYYSRLKETIARDYPDSLNFLSSTLATPAMEEERKSNWIEKFATSGQSENDIKIDSITLGDMRKQPYTAQVVFEKVFRNESYTDTKREKFISNVELVVQPLHDNQIVLTNPLGITITYLHVDQVFNQ